jgi:hypothetical protein
MTAALAVERLGRVPNAEALALQERLVAERAGRGPTCCCSSTRPS